MLVGSDVDIKMIRMVHDAVKINHDNHIYKKYIIAIMVASE